MMSNQAIHSLILIVSLGLLFLFGLSFENLSFKFYSLFFSISSIALMIFVPVRWALVTLFVFIGFQGFFKVVSSYHPIVHLGADLLVIAMLAKILFLYLNGQWKFPKEKIPFVPIFAIHFTWLLVVMFNPYALSIVSSIAGAKVYITMLLLYFLGFIYTKSRKDVHLFMWTYVLIAAIQAVFTIYQGFAGPTSVTGLHPLYTVQLQKYLETAFRPFGLTHIPGGPSVYICYTIPFMLYFFFHYRSLILKSFLGALLPLSGMAFLFCQVRSAMVKALIGGALFLIGSMTGSEKMNRQMILNFAGILVVAIASLTYLLPSLMEASVLANRANEDAFERSLSSFELDSYKTARQGIMHRFVEYASVAPFGAGFARVGAAAGAFSAANNNDTYFEKGYFFADNFWLATLIEIGIPGMIIMTLMVFGLFFIGLRQWFQKKKRDTLSLQLAILSALFALLLGLYGAESIIYNPDSAFFWFFTGVLLKLQATEKLPDKLTS